MKQVRKFVEESLSSIHGPITPADVREGDLVFAKVLRLEDGLKRESVLRVWRISPLGVELLSTESGSFKKGMAIDLELKIGDQNTLLSGLIVDETTEANGNRFLHIRLTPKIKERLESIERRQSTRWICSDEFYPTAVAANPARFNDFIYFKIRDVSSGGVKLQTSLRNKFIVPGIVFDCIVNFPMVSQVKMKFVVKSVRIESFNGKEILSVGANYDTADKILAETISQYLLQFGAVASPEELRQSGLTVGTVSEAIQFSFVRTKEEYEKVLELRYLAYKAAGKLKEGATIASMADSYDARARIVFGKYKGELVCSARLVFNQFDDQMEQEKYIQWPAHLPRREEMVEVMRACTRPDFRGSDLLMALFKFMFVTVAQSGRRWGIICASDDMVPLYRRVGFKEVGITYLHAGLNNLRHTVMLGNLPECTSGKDVDFVTWNVVWSDVSAYLEQYGLIKPDPLSSVRLYIYRLLAPLAKFLYFMSKRKRSKT